MGITGIIAEFNPLHNGHRYLIDAVKQRGDTVISVMSGNYVQRGDLAVLPKYDRVVAALAAGVDICIELPTPWAMSTAQTFAHGAVFILDALNCVEHLVFGSECGDMALLKKTARLVRDIRFSEAFNEFLNKGMTFAAARQAAVAAIDSEAAGILKNPNDILAVEYINALDTYGSVIVPRCVKRVGAAHDSSEAPDIFASASYIRECVFSGSPAAAEEYMPQYSYSMLVNGNTADIRALETAILTKLRGLTPETLKELPDISEGIENRLFGAIRSANSLDELYNSIKTKRYTLSRVRRLVLSAFLGLKSEFTAMPPPYARILGMSKAGEELLRKIRKCAEIPVIMRVGEFDGMPEAVLDIFNTECLCTDLYSAALKNTLPCGMEYKQKIIKGELL